MDLTFELALLSASRAKLHKIMDGLPEEQLFFIPAGFNNNVLWHLGHCVASQQRLVYLRSHLPMRITDSYAANFKIGTSPAAWTTKPDPAEIRDSLLLTVQMLEKDIENNLFTHYEPMRTAMGFTLSNHGQAISYANFHEAEHTGNIQYLIKLIG